MVKLIKLKYKLDSYCNHKFVLAKIFVKKPKGEVNFNLKGRYLRTYYKCVICNHYISNHNYNLNQLYSGNYISSTYGDYEGLKRKFKIIKNLPYKRSDNHYRCIRINNFLKPFKQKLKVLDIGSGLGVFPNKLKSKKFNNFTLIETDDLNINFLKKHLNFKKVFKKQIHLKNKKFDLITLNKVLEHIPNPSSFLRKYLKNLKKNGFLYVEVPNIDAKFDKVGFEREEFYIEHHHVFSKTSLILMLIKLNLKILKIEKIKEPSSKYTLICFAQNKIN